MSLIHPHFHQIDLAAAAAHYNGMIPQGIHPNYVSMHPQMQTQHVVPHLQHLQNAQLLRSVPDFNSPTVPNTSTPPINSIGSPLVTTSTPPTTTSTSTTTPSNSNTTTNSNSNSPVSSSVQTPNQSTNLNSPISSTNSPNILTSTNKRISITQQTCLVEEKFSKNGVQKNVHVVVKNNPFLLTLSLLDSSLNFHQLSPEVQLVYDSESLKEVDSATVKPLEYKTRANEEGDQLTVELRIKVLSSQLEDMLFRAKVKIVDPRTRKELHGLTVVTHPIRVVSKPDQVKKKAKKRKRAPTDSLMDTLNRIEHQQKEQQRLLKKLCFFDKENLMLNPTTTTTTTTTSDGSPKIENDKKQNESENVGSTSEDDVSKSVVVPEKDEFQKAFKEFIGAFKQLQCLDPDGADGAFKINTCANDAQTMCEILELVKEELRKDDQYKDKHSQHHTDGDSPCSCKVCPYKQKVDYINQSYETYFNMFNNQQQQSATQNSVVPQLDYPASTSYIDPHLFQSSIPQPPQLTQQQQQHLQQAHLLQQDPQSFNHQYYLQQQQLQAQQQQQRLYQQQQAAIYYQQQQQQQHHLLQQQQLPSSDLQQQFQNGFIDFNSGLGYSNFPNTN
eukprot:gene11332-13876_t